MLQMSLINLIETGPWDPVAQSDKSPESTILSLDACFLGKVY